MTSLNFCARRVLSIHEVNQLSHTVSENRQFKVVEVHTDVEQQVSTYLHVQRCWLLFCADKAGLGIPESHHSGSEGSSFHSLHFYTTHSRSTKAT